MQDSSDEVETGHPLKGSHHDKRRPNGLTRSDDVQNPGRKEHQKGGYVFVFVVHEIVTAPKRGTFRQDFYTFQGKATGLAGNRMEEVVARAVRGLPLHLFGHGRSIV